MFEIIICSNLVITNGNHGRTYWISWHWGSTYRILRYYGTVNIELILHNYSWVETIGIVLILVTRNNHTLCDEWGINSFYIILNIDITSRSIRIFESDKYTGILTVRINKIFFNINITIYENRSTSECWIRRGKKFNILGE